MNETTVIKDFHNVIFDNFRLPIIAVYFNTSDFPDKYIARIWDLDTPTRFAVIRDTLEGIHDTIPSKFSKLDAHPHDDKVIVETWI